MFNSLHYNWRYLSQIKVDSLLLIDGNKRLLSLEMIFYCCCCHLILQTTVVMRIAGLLSRWRQSISGLDGFPLSFHFQKQFFESHLNKTNQHLSAIFVTLDHMVTEVVGGHFLAFCEHATSIPKAMENCQPASKRNRETYVTFFISWGKANIF